MGYIDKDDERKWFRTRYANNVEIIKQMKLSSGCVDCGYKEHHAGLEFDHIQPRLRGTVASQMGKSMKVILEEIARCEIVCGTCHQIREYERRQIMSE